MVQGATASVQGPLQEQWTWKDEMGRPQPGTSWSRPIRHSGKASRMSIPLLWEIARLAQVVPGRAA